MSATMTGALRSALARYHDRSAVIGVVGLGYVGLPLVKATLQAGFRVIGVDSDPEKISILRSGGSYIRHIPAEFINKAFDGGQFCPTTDVSSLNATDAIVICVPTPLTVQREPDLTFIESTSRAIVPHLKRGQLVVLESTTYPGTTREMVTPILERSGLRSERDFFVAYSPEREDPGNPACSITTIPKVIGADGPGAVALASAFYATFVPETVLVSSSETAEAVKLTENIFRAVNIALVNELKTILTEIGIDVWEVINAAKTKPFGFMPFYPGPGLGGHCVPIDPFYLTWKARQHGLSTRFIELAGEINSQMPSYVVAQTANAFDRRTGRALRGAKILIVGVAYKKNVDDTRESPSFKLIELFEARGAICDLHDPYVQVVPRLRAYPNMVGRRSIVLDQVIVATYDIVVIVTDHDCIDYKSLTRCAKLVIDTRNVCEKVGAFAANVVKT